MQTSVETSTLLKVGLLGMVDQSPAHLQWEEWSAALKVRLSWWMDGSGGPGPHLLPESMPAHLPVHPLTHSPTLQFRAESIVPERMKEMTRCIQEQDFQGFAQLTMKDSNQFHATCLDTFPPISYLNDTSRRIIQLVHRFNTHHGQTKVTACGREGASKERAGFRECGLPPP